MVENVNWEKTNVTKKIHPKASLSSKVMRFKIKHRPSKQNRLGNYLSQARKIS